MALETTNYVGGIRTTNYDRALVFIFDNKFATGEVTNGGGSVLDIPLGTVMGRVSATGKLKPMASGATDGSQFPVGILANALSIASSATASASICVSGTVNQNLLVLDGTDTLETVISARRIKDRIGADTVGIFLDTVRDLSGGFDN